MAALRAAAGILPAVAEARRAAGETLRAVEETLAAGEALRAAGGTLRAAGGTLRAAGEALPALPGGSSPLRLSNGLVSEGKGGRTVVDNAREDGMRLTLRIWRQRDAAGEGRMVPYELDGVSPDMSFLEMLDMLNERLILAGEDPVAFDHDCREGICGTCSLVIDGIPHGPRRATATCQLHMRHFGDGDVITVEPWRAAAFPVVKDLVVDRSAFDRIIQAGGYISAPTGSAGPNVRMSGDVWFCTAGRILYLSPPFYLMGTFQTYCASHWRPAMLAVP